VAGHDRPDGFANEAAKTAKGGGLVIILTNGRGDEGQKLGPPDVDSSGERLIGCAAGLPPPLGPAPFPASLAAGRQFYIRQKGEFPLCFNSKSKLKGGKKIPQYPLGWKETGNF